MGEVPDFRELALITGRYRVGVGGHGMDTEGNKDS